MGVQERQNALSKGPFTSFYRGKVYDYDIATWYMTLLTCMCEALALHPAGLR